MSKKPVSKKKTPRSGKRAFFKLRLFPLKLYIFLLPFAIFVGGYVFFTSMTKGQLPNKDEIACCIPDFSDNGEFDGSEKIAYFEGQQVPAPVNLPTLAGKSPTVAQNISSKSVLGLKDTVEKWIEVDLSEQKLQAWEGNNLFLESAVSTGKRWTPTPTGEFTVWYKTKSQKMSGGEGASYYYLPNVPYIMFFQNSEVSGYRGYSLHGTYWHNNFGNQMSHGCVNLPTPIAEQLYYWTTPNLEDGKYIVRATDDNPGTKIVIHE